MHSIAAKGIYKAWKHRCRAEPIIKIMKSVTRSHLSICYITMVAIRQPIFLCGLTITQSTRPHHRHAQLVVFEWTIA